MGKNIGLDDIEQDLGNYAFKLISAGEGRVKKIIQLLEKRLFLKYDFNIKSIATSAFKRYKKINESARYDWHENIKFLTLKQKLSDKAFDMAQDGKNIKHIISDLNYILSINYGFSLEHITNGAMDAYYNSINEGENKMRRRTIREDYRPRRSFYEDEDYSPRRRRSFNEDEDYSPRRRSTRDMYEGYMSRRSLDLYEDIAYRGRDWKKSLNFYTKKQIKSIPRGRHKEFETAFHTLIKKVYKMVENSREGKFNDDMSWEVIGKNKWIFWADEEDGDNTSRNFLAQCIRDYWYYFHEDNYDI